MQVDPANRLVADSLEADWNGKLRALAEAHGDYQRQRTADRVAVDPEHARSASSRSPPTSPPSGAIRTPPSASASGCWRSSSRMSRCSSSARSPPHVRFRGGATTTLTLPRPLTAWELRATSAEVRQQMNALLDEYTDAQVAALLTSGACAPARARPSTRPASSGSASRPSSRASRNASSTPAC